MTSPFFTASALERVHACPASVALPQVITTSEYAERGNAIHLFCERVISGEMPRDVALAMAPKAYRDTCKGIDFDKILVGLVNVKAETSYAVGLDGTVRLLGHGIGRRYVVQPGEVPGTTDVRAVHDASDRVVVIDFKTGRDVTDCEDNFQLAFAAYAEAALRDADECEARIVYIHDDGKHHVDPCLFTRFDLELFHARMVDAYERAAEAVAAQQAGRRLTVNPGDHCRYCPAFPVCPAQVSLARAMVDGAEFDTKEPLTPESAGLAWEKLKRFEAVYESVRESLRAYAKVTPLPLTNGKELRETSYSKTSFSATKAKAFLSQEQLEDCETSVMVSQIRELKRRPL